MKLLKWLVTVGLLVVIAALSCASKATVNQWGRATLDAFGAETPAVRQWVMNSPHLWHVALYSLLTFGLMLTLDEPKWRGPLLALAAAALLETAQMFIPSRQAGLVDFIFSAAGVAGMFGILYLWQTASKDSAKKLQKSKIL